MDSNNIYNQQNDSKISKYSNLRKLNSNRIQKYNEIFNSSNNKNDEISLKNKSSQKNDFLKNFNLILKNNTKKTSCVFNNKKIINNLIHFGSIKFDKDIKFDLNKSIIDQVISNNTKHSQDGDTKSKFDIKLTENVKNTKSDVEITFKLDKFQIKKYENISTSKHNYPISENLAKIGANQVQLDCFQHIVQYSKSLISNNFTVTKYEFVYSNEKFYWPCRIKPIFHNLYQFKLNNKLINDENQSPESSSLNESLPNSNKNDEFKWIFSINSSSEFSNLFLNHLKPLGYSKKNPKIILKHPQVETTNDLFNLLDSDKSNSLDLKNDLDFIQSHTFQSKENFSKNTYIELITASNSVHVCKIVENYGGRLLIQDYYQTKFQYWLFYLDYRIKPLGWAKCNEFTYDNSSDDLIDELKSSNPQISSIDSIDSSQNNMNQEDHDLRNQRSTFFKLNYYMELLYMNKFYICKVIDLNEKLFYFKIKIDSKNDNNNKILTFYFNNNINNSTSSNQFHNLFPCNWCSNNNLYIQPPSNWTDESKIFDWDVYKTSLNENNAYLTQTSDLPMFNWSRNLYILGEKFQLGSYLEFSELIEDNFELKEIHLAKIKAKIGHIIFVQPVTSSNDDENMFIFSCDSFNLYPVGWCEMNNFHILNEFPNVKINDGHFEIRHDLFANIRFLSDLNDLSDNRKYWCNKLYLNTNFNCGPYFLKSNLNKLPKSFGPGPIVLVFYNVIFINLFFKL